MVAVDHLNPFTYLLPFGNRVGGNHSAVSRRSLSMGLCICMYQILATRRFSKEDERRAPTVSSGQTAPRDTLKGLYRQRSAIPLVRSCSCLQVERTRLGGGGAGSHFVCTPTFFQIRPLQYFKV